MYNSQNKKTLQIVLVVLIAVLSLGIGYATISNINLIIDGNATANPNDNNFKVHFVETADTPNLTGNVTLTGSADIDNNDNTLATFNVGGLTKTGDYAIATYTIINDSNDVGAKLSLELTNSNADYFKVTETITDTELQAGDTTTGTVKVELINTPVNNEVTTSITAKIKATAVENDSASGGDSTSKQLPTAFASDSWATIKANVQNGNTSQYDIGDTKTVTIDEKNYTVRISNKNTETWCDDENYSQTACGFVVEFTDIITLMKMSDSKSSGTYTSSLVYSYLKNTLYEKLPIDLQNVIIDTRVLASKVGGVTTSYDKLYLLTHKEITGTGGNGYENDSPYSKQLDYYISKGVYVTCGQYSGCSANNSQVLIKKFEGENNNWWMRSIDGYKFHCYAPNPEGATNGTVEYGVSPAFRIG